MDICPDCNRRLGTNGRCETCLEHVVTRGARGIDEERASEAVEEAEGWFEGPGLSAPRNLYRQARLIWEMVSDYLSGEYRDIPWSSIPVLVFALLYLMNPLDLIPDFIPVIGWIDDVLVMGLVLKGIRRDLLKYCKHKGYDPAEYGLEE